MAEKAPKSIKAALSTQPTQARLGTAAIRSAAPAASMLAAGNHAVVMSRQASHPGPASGVPRAVSQRLDVRRLTDEEVIAEIAALDRWLTENQASNFERREAQSDFSMLREESARRELANRLRSVAPSLPGWSAELQVAGAGLGFVSGFLMGLDREVQEEEAWGALMAQLSPLPARFEFQAGVTAGIYWGAAGSLYDNATDLAMMAGLLAAASVVGMMAPALLGSAPLAIGALKEILPEEYQAVEEALRRAASSIKDDLIEFIDGLRKDPAYLFEKASGLGLEVGAEAAAWINDTFMRASPGWKGLYVGRVLGYALMEIVLFFVAPEELLIKAGGRAARGLSKLSRRLLNTAPDFTARVKSMLKRSPRLRRLLEKAEHAKDATRSAPSPGSPLPGRTLEHTPDTAPGFDVPSTKPSDTYTSTPDARAAELGPAASVDAESGLASRGVSEDPKLQRPRASEVTRHADTGPQPRSKPKAKQKKRKQKTGPVVEYKPQLLPTGPESRAPVQPSSTVRPKPSPAAVKDQHPSRVASGGTPKKRINVQTQPQTAVPQSFVDPTRVGEAPTTALSSQAPAMGRPRPTPREHERQVVADLRQRHPESFVIEGETVGWPTMVKRIESALADMQRMEPDMNVVAPLDRRVLARSRLELYEEGVGNLQRQILKREKDDVASARRFKKWTKSEDESGKAARSIREPIGGNTPRGAKRPGHIVIHRSAEDGIVVDLIDPTLNPDAYHNEKTVGDALALYELFGQRIRVRAYDVKPGNITTHVYDSADPEVFAQVFRRSILGRSVKRRHEW